MAITNPNDSPLLRRIEALEQLLQANPNRSLSVERGVTEYYDQSMLLITDSNLRVVGVAYVEGRLEGEGTFSWSGPALLDGPVEITDTLRVLAATTLEAVTRLLSELQVEGKITAGDVRIEDGKVYVGDAMVLDPAVDGGAALFSNGSKLYSNTTAIGLRKGSSAVTVGDSIASLLAGGKAITVGSDRIDVLGLREVAAGPGVRTLGITTSDELVIVSGSA
ncbi:hypothetical protein RWH43_00860 [Microbacterium sp. KSW2-21]|uniref:Uncharacterized protein n=1 Tax=Microbacterium algihabitans TaxID=3075992 RepID=A0ABU3RR41_9MICO|nr:hypothetical protein [Microbacterium sp. KSW2-21]MDU0325294.1 hypothetical protein [Microbacterium sp. KSW2-21]